MIDLVRMKALVFQDDRAGLAASTTVDIPAELREQADEHRAQAGRAGRRARRRADGEVPRGRSRITEDEIRAAIRKGCIALKLFPVLCGSAFKHKGVQPLLDAVVDYLPSPLDIPPVTGKDPKGNDVTRETQRRRAVLRRWRSRS